MKRNGEKPAYQEVIDWIMDGIASGSLRINDKLPSEKELSEKFGLSRQTIRHATGILEKKRIITKVRGSGTYIGVNRVLQQREKTMNIAVMLTFAYSYIFAPVLVGISNVLNENGYTAQISFTNNSTENEKKILTNLIENDNIDALIAEPSRAAHGDPNRQLYEEIRARGIPVLFLNASYPDLDAPCIRLDDFKVAEAAVTLAVKYGHRKIGGIFHSDDIQGQERYRGYISGLHKAGIEADGNSILWLDTVAIADMEPVMDYILLRLKGCSAVLTYNDEVASQLIRFCRERGISLPRELSIVSIDDADVSSTTNPKITTFPHPKEVLGQKAAESILRMLREPFYDENYFFTPEPIIRESLIEKD